MAADRTAERTAGFPLRGALSGAVLRTAMIEAPARDVFSRGGMASRVAELTGPIAATEAPLSMGRNGRLNWAPVAGAGMGELVLEWAWIVKE